MRRPTPSTIPSWDTDYRGFLEFFFSNVFPEAHSTKQIEDSIDWALETTAEVLSLAIVCDRDAGAGAGRVLTR